MPASQLKTSKGNATYTGSNDSRGNPIYRRDDGALITNQGGKLVLSAPARPKQSDAEKLPQSPESKEALKALDDALNKLEQRGQTLNPNIKLDDETMQRFLDQAERELSPYYAAIIKAKKEDLAEYLSILQLDDKDAVSKRFEEFDTRLEGRDASLQNRGLISSGERLKTYRDEAKFAERDAAAAERARRSGVRGTVRSYEDYLGGKNLADVTPPTEDRATFGTRSFLTDERGRRVEQRTEASPLFTLRPDIVGKITEDQKVAVETRRGELIAAEQRRRAAEEDAKMREELNKKINEAE